MSIIKSLFIREGYSLYLTKLNENCFINIEDTRLEPEGTFRGDRKELGFSSFSFSLEQEELKKLYKIIKKIVKKQDKKCLKQRL